MEEMDKEHYAIGKELDPTNPEDLFDYSQICSTRRNLRNYWKEENETTRSIYWKMY